MSLLKLPVSSRHDDRQQLEALAKRGNLPPPTRLEITRVAAPGSQEFHPKLLEIWRAHAADVYQNLSKRELEQVVGYSRQPSELIAISAVYEINGKEHYALAGHYAVDDRDNRVEFLFDRSFIGGKRLQSLAIDFRMYLISIAMALSGRDRIYVPTYASFYSGNTRSRQNYRDAGAIELTGLPGCLREDGIPGDTVINGLIFSVISPAVLEAGFLRMLTVLQQGVVPFGDVVVPLVASAGDLITVEYADQLRADIKRATRRQEVVFRKARDEYLKRIRTVTG